MPEATLTAFRDQWFHTGGVVRQDAEGRLYFVGRRNDKVRRRGKNISAAEVEQAIEQHPEVLCCAVVGVPSALTEEGVLACVLLRPAVPFSHSLCRGRRLRVGAELGPQGGMTLQPAGALEQERQAALGCCAQTETAAPPK